MTTPACAPPAIHDNAKTVSAVDNLFRTVI
jgi:hypothetical protein